MRPGVGRLLATAAMAMIGAGPALAEPRAIALQPGSGIVRRVGPAPKRRDGARQAEAQAKRERKNRQRRRDWLHSFRCNPCHGNGPRGHLVYALGAHRGE